MNILDEAHALARHLKETEEYQTYIRLKEVAYADSTNETLLNEYKRMQFRLQTISQAEGSRTARTWRSSRASLRCFS